MILRCLFSLAISDIIILKLARIHNPWLREKRFICSSQLHFLSSVVVFVSSMPLSWILNNHFLLLGRLATTAKLDEMNRFSRAALNIPWHVPDMVVFSCLYLALRLLSTLGTLGFGLRASGFWLRASGFGIQASGFVLRASGVGLQPSALLGTRQVTHSSIIFCLVENLVFLHDTSRSISIVEENKQRLLLCFYLYNAAQKFQLNIPNWPGPENFNIWKSCVSFGEILVIFSQIRGICSKKTALFWYFVTNEMHTIRKVLSFLWLGGVFDKNLVAFNFMTI